MLLRSGSVFRKMAALATDGNDTLMRNKQIARTTARALDRWRMPVIHYFAARGGTWFASKWNSSSLFHNLFPRGDGNPHPPGAEARGGSQLLSMSKLFQGTPAAIRPLMSREGKARFQRPRGDRQPKSRPPPPRRWSS